MKKIRCILFFAVVLACCSCTQNNGHIGKLFGSWHLDSMTVDGKRAALPEGTETYFSFQGNIIMVTLSEDVEIAYRYFGTWVRDEDILTFDFTHSSDDAAPGEGGYQAPAWLGFPHATSFSLNITELDGGHMTLLYDTPRGNVRVYKFTKTW